jgi:hypothetical protein
MRTNGLTQLFFRGRANLEATTAWLLASEGLGNATDVVLTGGSAGATGVFLGADFFRGLLPKTTRVVANPDAGFFLDEPRAKNATDFWYRESFQAADQVWGSVAAGNLNSGCLRAFASEPWRCYLAQYSTPYIETPMYISNSAIDMWGLGNILSLGCIPTMTNSSTPKIPGQPCDAAGWESLQNWWGQFQAALRPLLERNPALGAFAVSCYVHEINVDYCSGQSLPNCRGWNSYQIQGKTLSTAFPLWHSNAIRNWEIVQDAFFSKAKEASLNVGGERRSALGVDLGPGQDVDTYTYPMNPSCVYPPG